MLIALKVIGIIAAVLVGLYVLLFIVFYFDLDGKLLFNVVEPALCKRYDKLERRDPLHAVYGMDKPHYEYETKK